MSLLCRQTAFSDGKLLLYKPDDDESACWEEVKHLALWCSENSISLNISKTKELLLTSWKAALDALLIKRRHGGGVSRFKFLGVHMSEDAAWTVNTTAVVIQDAQQQLYSLITHLRVTTMTSCSNSSQISFTITTFSHRTPLNQFLLSRKQRKHRFYLMYPTLACCLTAV